MVPGSPASAHWLVTSSSLEELSKFLHHPVGNSHHSPTLPGLNPSLPSKFVLFLGTLPDPPKTKKFFRVLLYLLLDQ